MNQPTPLLILSDSPSASSGLGRIARDLAIRLHEHCSDIFRVATFGYGGVGSRTLPFPQYHMTENKDWMLPDLPSIWQDFAGTHEPGVVFTIWDASRLLWFARPDQYCRLRDLRGWLQQTQLKRIGYFPIDAAGPQDKLSCMNRECLMGYDRILAYSRWAEGLIERTLGEDESAKRELASLPHGIDTSVFKRRDRVLSRKVFHNVMGFKGPEIRDDEIVIGIVATNQTRKDFGMAIQVVAELAKRMPIRLFIQTDALERFWSIPALLMDYDLVSRVIVNCGGVTDEIMSYIYTACDVTLGIGLGEGFGYPIFESLACGTPCVTGSYGGHAEHLPPSLMVDPIAYRLEGLYCCERPVFESLHWVVKVIRKALGRPCHLPPNLAWLELWPAWEQWFRALHQSLHRSQDANHLDSNIETDTGESDHDTSIAVSEADTVPGEASTERSLVSFPGRS